MAWCPKCKNEYVDGITRCTDCDVDLVDELIEEKDTAYIRIDSTELIDDIVDFLHQASIDSAEKYHDTEDDMDVISVNKKQYQDARLHTAVYLKNEELRASMEDSLEEDTEAEDMNETDNTTLSDMEEETFSGDMSDSSENEIEEQNEDSKDSSEKSVFSPAATYTKLSDKYEDVKSSAYTLLIVGSLGVIAMLLEMSGAYNLPISSHTKWLFYTVMGGIFIAFVISGIFSLMHATQLKLDAEKEDELIEQILTSFRENYTKESIDAAIDADTQEELLYFNRAEFMKNEIMHQFESADEPLVDSLIETLYQELFEQNKTDS